MIKEICIVCKKFLEEMDENHQWAPNTNSCTSWTSSGNFGSQIVDSVKSEYGVDKLIIFLCDECLKENEEYVLTLSITRSKETKKFGEFKTLRDRIRAEEVIES